MRVYVKYEYHVNSWVALPLMYLAGLAVHVEGGSDGRRDLSSAALHQVLGEAVGEVGLPCAAGAR